MQLNKARCMHSYDIRHTTFRVNLVNITGFVSLNVVYLVGEYKIACTYIVGKRCHTPSFLDQLPHFLDSPLSRNPRCPHLS